MFNINVTADDVPDSVSSNDTVQPLEDLEELEASGLENDQPGVALDHNPGDGNSTTTPSIVVEGVDGAEAAAALDNLPRLRETLPAIDVATDALHNEMSDSLYNLIPHSVNSNEGSDGPEASLNDSNTSNVCPNGITYAQNLDLHLQTTSTVVGK